MLLVGSEKGLGYVVHVPLLSHAGIYPHEAVSTCVNFVRDLHFMVSSQMLSSYITININSSLIRKRALTVLIESLCR